jgi:hypothetical protein
VKIDPNAFYAYAYRGGKDADEMLVGVTEAVFRVLKEHEDELDRGNTPEEAEEAMEAFWEGEDIMHEASEADIDSIHDDHFVRMTLC